MLFDGVTIPVFDRRLRRVSRPLQQLMPRRFGVVLALSLLAWTNATGNEPSDSASDWWSLRPIQEPTLPAAPKNESYGNPVDRFVFARLHREGLDRPSRANARTLIRRLSLVLTGLPPSRTEVESYLAECRGIGQHMAYRRLVDRLIASPYLGECWARHWMDVVRYSETHGNEWNYEVHHAWRYRDYLVRAINQDLPFDQLIREHIAGDLIEQPRWNEDGYCESLIGTAFYRFGEANHDDCVGLRSIGFDIADNQIDTLTKAFQATTVACARCHDHKLDPISMRDYYGLLGIVRSSRLVAHTIDAPDVNVATIGQLRKIKESIRFRLAGIWSRESRRIDKYLIAAEAAKNGQSEANQLAAGLDRGRLENWISLLKTKDVAREDPISVWVKITTSLATRQASETDELARRWPELIAEYRKQQQDYRQFNLDNFDSFADFRKTIPNDWQGSGIDSQRSGTASGEMILFLEGDDLVQSIVPAGFYTHVDSAKLGCSLRSPVLSPKRKRISFRVMGQRASAVRLVSNNCQLNYANYRALTSDNFQWVTFEIPAEAELLRTYAELMTMLANPKFPDQLGTLGGDKQNYRLPWQQAIANPRSWFGVTRVVLHDVESPPKPEYSYLDDLLDGTASHDTPRSLADVAGRYARLAHEAIESWADDDVSDTQVAWIRWLLKHKLLSNSLPMDAQLAELVARYREIESDQLRVPRFIPGMADAGQGYNQPILDRGDCLRPLEPVSRQYLDVLNAGKSSFRIAQGSGRLELANHIASAQNPLTSRVFANRVWHHLFGTGIVRTVDDFGHMGEPPSHPELLDYLAARFVQGRWSVKRLLRLVVMSDTFQMASRTTEERERVDPTNRLLHHFPVRRLSAEAIRDSILAVSGRLDLRQQGPSIAPFRNNDYPDRRLFAGPLDGDGRRSVYIKVNLMEPPEFLGRFNTPGGKLPQGRRDKSNVPAQSLALLNGPFVVQQARVWSRNLLHDDHDLEQRVEHMFEQALGRPPENGELYRFRRMIAQLSAVYAVDEDQVLGSQAIWQDLAHAFFNLKEFIFIH